MAVEIRAKLGSPRVGAVLLAFGALCYVGASWTDQCSMRPALAYGLTTALATAALGMLPGWKWARMTGRIVCWVIFILFAMLLVPDWEEAEFSGSYGLHTLCGALATYFLVCAVCLGFGRDQASTVPSYKPPSN